MAYLESDSFAILRILVGASKDFASMLANDDYVKAEQIRVAASEERLGQMAANEPGAAGD
jgi:hypothetical protein